MKMRRSFLVFAALALVMGLQMAGPATQPAEAEDDLRPRKLDAFVNGDILTVTFDKPLNPDHTPPGSWFKVRYFDEGTSSGHLLIQGTSAPVTISADGKTVTVRLSQPMPPSTYMSPLFTGCGGRDGMSYTTPSTTHPEELRGAEGTSGNEVLNFGMNERAGSCVGNITPPPDPTEATSDTLPQAVHGDYLDYTATINFNKNLDATKMPDAGAFLLMIPYIYTWVDEHGVTQSSAHWGTYFPATSVSIQGKTLALTYSISPPLISSPGTTYRPANHDELVPIGQSEFLAKNGEYEYNKGDTTVKLTDVDGNEVQSWGMEIANLNGGKEQGANSITSVEFTSTPSIVGSTSGSTEKDTYGRGDQIEVTVTYEREVYWRGSGDNIRLRLDVGGTTRVAKLVTHGQDPGFDPTQRARTLTFRYTVVQADVDDNGVATQTNDEGALITLAGDAKLQDFSHRDVWRLHAGLSADADHKVDGNRNGRGDTVGPRPIFATIDGSFQREASGSTVTITFDEDVGSVDVVDAFSVKNLYFVRPDGIPGSVLESVTPTAMSVSGRTVTLELWERHHYGPEFTIDLEYAAPTSGSKLVDGFNNPVRSFKIAMRNWSQRPSPDVLPAVPGPSTVTAAGRSNESVLTVPFTKGLKATPLPPAESFEVWVMEPDDTSRFLRGKGTVTIVPDFEWVLRVTLDGGLDERDIVARVWYHWPEDEASRLQDHTDKVVREFEIAGDGLMRPFRVQKRTEEPPYLSVLDKTPPELLYGVALGSEVVLSYHEALDPDSVPPSSRFVIYEGSGSSRVNQAISSVEIDGMLVIIKLVNAVSGNPLTFEYTADGDSQIQDKAGNPADGIVGQGLTVVGATGNTPPTVRADADTFIDGTTSTATKAYKNLVELAFTGILDPRSVPHKSAFTLRYPDFTTTLSDSTTEELQGGKTPMQVDLVLIEGPTVWLYLNGPTPTCLHQYVVEYKKPTDNPLKNLAGTEETDQVVSFEDKPVVNTEALTEGDPEFAEKCYLMPTEGESDGDGILMGTSSTPFRASAVSGRSFQVKATPPDGPTRTISGTGMARIEGGGVRVQLASPVIAGETLTASYARQSGEDAVRFTTGGQLGDFTDFPVTNNAPEAPVVTQVVLASDAGGDGAYVSGESVRVRLGFSSAVDVTGAPRLKIAMNAQDAGRRWAAYEGGGGTAELVFAYAVRETDTSSAGVAVLADTLELNGGAITSTSTGVAASLSHEGLSHDPNHRVDTTPPQPIGAEVDRTTLTITFDEGLAAAKEPPSESALRFRFTVRGTSVEQHPASVAINGSTVTLGLGTAAVGGQEVTVSYGAGGSGDKLRDASGNATAAFVNEPVTNRAQAQGPEPEPTPTPTPTLTPEPEETVPAKPTGLRVSTEAGSLDVSLAWDDVESATSYWVRWRGAGGKLNDGVKVGSSAAAITVDGHGRWVARVQACNDAGCGKPLAKQFEVEPAPPAREPTPTPDPLQVSVTASSATRSLGEPVTLSASISNAPDGAVPSYSWELQFGDSWSAWGTDSTFSYATGVAESQAFRITVTYGSGESATSEPLTVTWSE